MAVTIVALASLCCCFFSALLLSFSFFHVLRRRCSKLPLPPGSIGWPYVGETFQLYSQNPNDFFSQKQKRYGSIFKSHILGYPCVMLTKPEAIRFVLTQSRLFKPTFPASKMRMLGREALFFHQGDYHAKLRKLVVRANLPGSLSKMVPEINSIALDTLKSCDNRSVTAFHEMKTHAFNVALLSIFGKEDSFDREEAKRLYYVLEKGYNSMPIKLPRTVFHKAIKARKQLSAIVAAILHKRREKAEQHNDLLSSFMSKKVALTDAQISDNVIGMIFAARDTTASVLTWILKYLAENPSVLKAVTEEQEGVRRAKVKGDEGGLTWFSDTKKMPLTSRVIMETMRIASVLSFTFREAVEDVEYEGYLIPKGWKVLPQFRSIHHNPDIFSDPEKFEPSRFEVAPKADSFFAIWKWDPLFTWERVSEAGDFGASPSHYHKVQVDHFGITKWNSVWSFCTPSERVAHQVILKRHPMNDMDSAECTVQTARILQTTKEKIQLKRGFSLTLEPQRRAP